MIRTLLREASTVDLVHSQHSLPAKGRFAGSCERESAHVGISGVKVARITHLGVEVVPPASAVGGGIPDEVGGDVCSHLAGLDGNGHFRRDGVDQLEVIPSSVRNDCKHSQKISKGSRLPVNLDEHGT